MPQRCSGRTVFVLNVDVVRQVAHDLGSLWVVVAHAKERHTFQAVLGEGIHEFNAETKGSRRSCVQRVAGSAIAPVQPTICSNLNTMSLVRFGIPDVSVFDPNLPMAFPPAIMPPGRVWFKFV